MISAAQARDILTAQWTALTGEAPPWRAVRLVMAQSKTEGQWGDFGGYSADGTHEGNNWGGVQAKMGPPCPPGTFEAGDSKPGPNGQKPFRWCFMGYPTLEDGARDFLRHAIILRPKARTAALSGDPRWFAEELRNTNYYGGFSTTLGEGPEAEAKRWEEQVSGYTNMLRNNATAIDQALGLPPPAIDSRPPSKAPGPGKPTVKKAKGGGALLALAAGAAALVAISR